MKSKILILFVILLVITNLKAQIPTNGLVLNLPLDGNVNDSSSYKNVCENHGITTVADRSGRMGKAMYFDGYSYIRIPSTKALDLTTDKSISCWVYIPSTMMTNMYPTLVYKQEPLKNSATYCIQLAECVCYNSNQHKITTLFTSDLTHYQTFSKQLYSDNYNKWLNIVYTYDTISGYLKTYLNGQISDSTYCGKIVANTSNLDLNIGCGHSDDYRTYFNGYLDDVLVYNRGLSAIEINQIYTEKFMVNAGADKTVACSEPVKLDSVTTTYTGQGNLKYKWTPAIGLNNDTIAHPTCTTAKDVTYSVTVTTPDGTTATGNVSVHVNFSPINTSTIYKYLNCGQSMKFDSIKTNYSGTSALKYKWSPSTGLDNDSIATPSCKISQSAYYTVTITTQGGCSTTAKVYASVSSSYSYLYTYKTVSCGDTIKLATTTTGLKYKWTPSTGLNSDTIANPIATLTSNMAYSCTVTTSLGCIASIEKVYITYTKTAKPAILGVGVDKNNKNVIVWDKSAYSNAKTFNIYRETNVANIYSKIGNVSNDSTSIFADTLSFPNVQSNRYKLSIVDKCGYETDLSGYHKTMHLSINQGVNKSWNLIWESYEGFSVSTYNIYRGSKASSFELVGSLSGNNNQFSDFTPPTGNVYYQIEAIKSNPVTVSSIKSKAKSTDATVYSSRSNIATNASETGINVLKDISNMISIYPNPTSDKLELTISGNINPKSNLFIYNILGSIIKSERLSSNKQIIDLGNLTNGIYMLVVKSDKFTGSQKLIIQK